MPTPKEQLKQALTNIASSVRNRESSSESMLTTAIPAKILGLPRKDKEIKDINFLGYYGEVLYSYTKEEFLELRSMPPLVEDEAPFGFKPDKWTWNLEDILAAIDPTYPLDHNIGVFKGLNIYQSYNSHPTLSASDIKNGSFFKINLNSDLNLSPTFYINPHLSYRWNSSYKITYDETSIISDIHSDFTDTYNGLMSVQYGYAEYSNVDGKPVVYRVYPNAGSSFRTDKIDYQDSYVFILSGNWYRIWGLDDSNKFSYDVSYNGGAIESNVKKITISELEFRIMGAAYFVDHPNISQTTPTTISKSQTDYGYSNIDPNNPPTGYPNPFTINYFEFSLEGINFVSYLKQNDADMGISRVFRNVTDDKEYQDVNLQGIFDYRFNDDSSNWGTENESLSLYRYLEGVRDDGQQYAYPSYFGLTDVKCLAGHQIYLNNPFNLNHERNLQYFYYRYKNVQTGISYEGTTSNPYSVYLINVGKGVLYVPEQWNYNYDGYFSSAASVSDVDGTFTVDNISGSVILNNETLNWTINGTDVEVTVDSQTQNCSFELYRLTPYEDSGISVKDLITGTTTNYNSRTISFIDTYTGYTLDAVLKGKASSTVQVNWGDGTVSELTGTIPYSGKGYVKHTYSQKGEYIIKITPKTNEDFYGISKNKTADGLYEFAGFISSGIEEGDTRYLNKVYNQCLIDARIGNSCARAYGVNTFLDCINLRSSYRYIVDSDSNRIEDSCGTYTFKNCISLLSCIICKEDAPVDFLYNGMKGSFINCSSLKHLGTPRCVKTTIIDQQAWQMSQQMSQLDETFSGCTNLEEIFLYVDRINDNTFKDCNNLKAIDLSSSDLTEGLLEVGTNAINNMLKVEKIDRVISFNISNNSNSDTPIFIADMPALKELLFDYFPCDSSLNVQLFNNVPNLQKIETESVSINSSSNLIGNCVGDFYILYKSASGTEPMIKVPALAKNKWVGYHYFDANVDNTELYLTESDALNRQNRIYIDENHPAGNYYFREVPSMTITQNLLGVTSSYVSDTISYLASTRITITPNTGYNLPYRITVTGADYTYDMETGYIDITNVYSNVIIEVIGVEKQLQALEVGDSVPGILFNTSASYQDICDFLAELTPMPVPPGQEDTPNLIAFSSGDVVSLISYTDSELGLTVDGLAVLEGQNMYPIFTIDGIPLTAWGCSEDVAPGWIIGDELSDEVKGYLEHMGMTKFIDSTGKFEFESNEEVANLFNSELGWNGELIGKQRESFIPFTTGATISKIKFDISKTTSEVDVILDSISPETTDVDADPPVIGPGNLVQFADGTFISRIDYKNITGLAYFNGTGLVVAYTKEGIPLTNWGCSEDLPAGWIIGDELSAEVKGYLEVVGMTQFINSTGEYTVSSPSTVNTLLNTEYAWNGTLVGTVGVAQ